MALRNLGLFAQAGVALLGASVRAAPDTYPGMAKLEQYLVGDQAAEIALARSAAPSAISKDASVLVLEPTGYETAVQGTNGFTCLVQRSWTAPFDHPDFWNPKLRAPICYNAPATRSVLPMVLHRTQLALSGLSKEQMLTQLKAEQARHPSVPEVGAMSYMMSRSQYLTSEAGAWMPHLMFHLPKMEGISWGANAPGSPVIVDDEHREDPERQTIFMVPAGHWSDGTPAPVMND